VIQLGVVMRKVFGTGVLLMALLAVSGCAAGGAKVDGKIGVVDPARVLSDTNAGKKAKDSLTIFSKNRQALIEMDEKELRRMEEDFGRQASVLSPTAKRERRSVSTSGRGVSTESRRDEPGGSGKTERRARRIP
jgi:Skp family chaperone for outer membrane proteins